MPIQLGEKEIDSPEVLVLVGQPRRATVAELVVVYLGNPLACAAALANIYEIERYDLVHSVRARAQLLAGRLARLRQYTKSVREIRGLGYMWAIEFVDSAIAATVVTKALQRGVILLQSGPTGSSITIAPPLTIEQNQLERAIAICETIVAEIKR